MNILSEYLNDDIAFVTMNLFEKNEKYYLNGDWKSIKNPVIFAILNNNFKLLKWAFEHKYVLSSKAFSYAAAYGNFEILEWLYDNNCPWNSEACAYAAGCGNFEVLKWLHKKKCLMNMSSNILSSENGHYDIFKWTQENMIYKEYTYLDASKCYDISKWINDNKL